MTDPYIVKPVHRALEMLKVIGFAGESLTVAEVARRSGLPKSTAFKYLRTAFDAGYLVQEGSGDAYRLGLIFWQLAQLQSEHQLIRDVTKPHLVALRDLYDETTNLGVVEGSEVIYLDIVESRRPLRMQAVPGGRYPAVNTALGKSILATAGRHSEVDTAGQICDAEWQDILARGYAVDLGESDDGVNCVAAPIVSSGGRVVAAISMSGPKYRVSESDLHRIAVDVLRTADEVSRSLGHTTSSP